LLCSAARLIHSNAAPPFKPKNLHLSFTLMDASGMTEFIF
jgi:hypothetical protein